MTRPVPNASAIVRRHLFAAVVVTLGIVAALVGVEWSLATAEADRVTRAAATRVAERVSSVLSASDFARESIDVATLDGQLAGFFAAGSVARVKVWRVEGDTARVVFSDERRLIGDQRPFSPALAERLARDGVVVLDVPDDAEHRFEANGGAELREALIAFEDAGGAPLRLEVYVPVFRDAWVASTLAVNVPVLVGGIAALMAVLLPLTVRLARRLSAADVDRSLAIEFGLRSRERERLRLGRRLHDDVLQDLAGSALALEALASAPDPARLRTIAATLSTDARTLRGILDGTAVGPAPPLGHALADAVSAARAAGVTVDLDAIVDEEPDAETSRLVVEAARELVRNVVEHACATRVEVSLRASLQVVALTVTDDGRGFDPGRGAASGHGLRLLQRAFAEANGDLTVTSTADGTRVSGRLPVPGTSVAAPRRPCFDERSPGGLGSAAPDRSDAAPTPAVVASVASRRSVGAWEASSEPGTFDEPALARGPGGVLIVFIHRATRSLAGALSLVVAIGLTGGAAAHATADPVDPDSSTTGGRWHTAEERTQSREERSAPMSPNRLFSAAEAPANDLLAHATKVSSLPFDAYRQPFGGATLEADEPATCRTTDPDSTEYFTDGERSTWYSYTSPVAQTLSFGGGVDGRNSMIVAYAAAAMSELSRISCTETGFRDENHLQAKAGTTYLFQVTDDAYSAAATDTASLWIRASAPIPNLSPATSTTVAVPSTVTGSIAKVDNNWYAPYYGSCDLDFVTMLGTRWYKYVATSTTGVRADLRASYYNADAVVWASDGSVPTTKIGCVAQGENDSSGPGFYDKANAYADFAVEPGKTYFIQVGGWNFGVGDYQLTLSTYQLPLMTSTPTPKITGTAQVGSTLTANPGTWDEGATLTYQWMRGGGTYISGAKSSTYTVSAADVGTQITVAVTASKPGYSGARKTSAPTAVVAKGVLTSAAPTLSGTPVVGTTVTAVPGAWGPSPVTYTYQWLRGGAPISGATSATYTPVAADAGTPLAVTVTGAKSGFTTKAVTSTSATVARGTLTGATPTISGTAKVGSTLTARAGTWSPAPVTLTYQWLRNGTVISGATATTYKLTATDKGKRITVRVTGTKTGYAALAKTSAATATIG